MKPLTTSSFNLDVLAVSGAESTDTRMVVCIRRVEHKFRAAKLNVRLGNIVM